MQPRRRLAAAGQDEGLERREARIDAVDLAFEPDDLLVGDAQPAVAGLAGRAQIGADVEQVVLDPRQRGVDIGRRRQPRQADRGIRLVDGAIGGDAGIVLGDARAVTQRGLATVAAARIDPGQPDQISALSAS